MDIVLTPNRIKKSVVILILLVFITVFFCACDEPYNVSENWISEDPYFLLCYSRDTDGILIQDEQLELDGELINVDLMFGRGVYCVYPQDSNNYDERLLSGTWKYRNGDLVLEIEEDFVFSNQYSELILIPSKK